jgi:oxygen-independent coproporphyrinogen-3 oxidase
VGGTHFQNEHEFGPYIVKLEAGSLPIFRALTPTKEERLIRELVLQTKLGRVRSSHFEKKYGVEIRDRFAEQLASLHNRGFLRFEDDGFSLSRDGLLQVDRLLHDFFLPEHRNARYV